MTLSEQIALMFKQHCEAAGMEDLEKNQWYTVIFKFMDNDKRDEVIMTLPEVRRG